MVNPADRQERIKVEELAEVAAAILGHQELPSAVAHMVAGERLSTMRMP
jgi:hypothetical protein